MKLRLVIALAMGLGADLGQAAAEPLGFAGYLAAVEQHSLDLASQRESVVAAQAGVSIAALRPDPSLGYSLGPKEFSSEVDPKPRLSQSVSLSWTVETGGKRERRVQLAQSNVKLASALFDGARRALFSTAASAFSEACRSDEALTRQEETLRALSEVVRANEARRKAGDLGGLELLQSRSERDRYQSTVNKARADAATARINLSPPLGRRLSDVFGEPTLACSFAAFEPAGDVSALVAEALRTRDDVQIARAALEGARSSADLARANRYVDPSVSLSYSYSPHGRSSVGADGAPVGGSARSNTLGLSLSVPIPVSRLQRGELIQAESAVTQALLALQQAELKAEADVRVTEAQFRAARENLARYRDSVLADSQKVLEGMRLSYRNGAASLLELLAAQRSADEVYLAYLQAQADLATATVQLQLSIGRKPAL